MKYVSNTSNTNIIYKEVVIAPGGNISVTACCDVGFTFDTYNIYANETTITCQINIDNLKVNCVNGSQIVS